MKVLTISFMQNPRQISLYLNHDKEEHLPLLYKKLLLCCESWSIHKNMCNIRLYLNTEYQYRKQLLLIRSHFTPHHYQCTVKHILVDALNKIASKIQKY